MFYVTFLLWLHCLNELSPEEINKTVPPVRIELTTSGLWDLRSTNWAKETSKSLLITWLSCPSTSISYLMMMGQIAIDTNKFVEKRHECACSHRSYWLPVYAQWFLQLCAWSPRSWHQVLSIAPIEKEDSQSCGNWASEYIFCIFVLPSIMERSSVMRLLNHATSRLMMR